MARKKKYCPLDNIPVVDPLPKTWVRVARNIHVSEKGWVVRYYNKGEWFVEEYSSREEVVSAYPGLPDGVSLV